MQHLTFQQDGAGLAPPPRIVVRGNDMVRIASIISPFSDEPMLETHVPLGFQTVHQIILTWYHAKKSPAYAQGSDPKRELDWGDF